MACHQEASSSNSSNSYLTPKTWKYDIFLSFRGEDTRRSFTDHLYHALKRSGFRVFRDDVELPRGEVISEKLKQGIENSNFAIVIFSKNYASSSWCLDELQHILYSRDNSCQQVFPIFYDVDPSDVRHQTGNFAEAFKKHQRDNKVIQSWSHSLTNVANLSGWDCRNRNEAELINTVIEELWTKLLDRLPPYSEDLIGIDNRVQQLESLLEIGLNDVRFVGIWGLPGVGKTTIARAVFDKYGSQFENKCFLHNVRATSDTDGEVQLQSKLISDLNNRKMEIKDTYEGKKIMQNCFRNKNVLLILDDVSHTTHFEILANSPNWFGTGSRVIITTRDSNLLLGRVHEVYQHEVKTMSSSESLQLFCQKAFGRGEPQKDLLELAETVCDYAKGLPLALTVLGSHFGGRSVSEWEDTLDILKKDPHRDIISSLEISFYALTDTEKEIFLDIACFFNGWREGKIIQILESCGFNNAKTRIRNLQRKSLLEDYADCLVMHDLLAQMGRKIVVESSTDVGHRTRLWFEKDIDTVMKNNLGTKEIQGMVSFISLEGCWGPETFSILRNLRLLIIITSNLKLPDGLKCLSHALKVLHWTNYPLKTLPPGTRLDNFVDLRMHHSKLKKLWNKSLCSGNLKFLDLSYSKNLIETPDFSECPNLERLELEECEALVHLHDSIGQLKKVRVLNLKGCKNLRCCPKKLEMSALKEFVLCGCIRVKHLPEFWEPMKNLEMLDAGETNLVKLPESLGVLSGLVTLKLRGCKNLVCLPQSFHKLKRLELVDIAGCSKFARLPENLNEMEALEEIDASETDITEVPSSFGGLKKVRKLSFGGCKRSTANSCSLIRMLSHMFWVRSTHNSLTLPASIFNLKSLKQLDLSYRSIDDGSIPYSFNGLSSLEELNLSGNKFKNLPAGCISNLLNLKYLFLDYCSELRSLPQLGPSLGTMNARECGSLETMSDKQLSPLFASIDQARRWMRGEILDVLILGSEIPSWFDNQVDLCLDDRGEALMMIDTPPSGEEMLGIGLCIVLGDDMFCSSEPNKRPLVSPCCRFDFAEFPHPRDRMPVICGRQHFSYREESSHLWMVFWKQGEELSRILQLSEYSHIPVTFSVNDGGKLGKKVSVKCGWRVISKRDFENRDNSTSHNPLPAAEQQIDQAIRIPMPREWESRSISVRPNIIELDDFWKNYENDSRRGDLCKPCYFLGRDEFRVISPEGASQIVIFSCKGASQAVNLVFPNTN